MMMGIIMMMDIITMITPDILTIEIQIEDIIAIIIITTGIIKIIEIDITIINIIGIVNGNIIETMKDIETTETIIIGTVITEGMINKKNSICA
ncbi:MAG: hypothetical protein K5657_09415 [Desulfovibrio sp.]|nr:hypothetical protein [Desulfovibrio sp.]